MDPTDLAWIRDKWSELVAKLDTEIVVLRETNQAQTEYIEFLGEACAGAEAFCANHGVTISTEDFEKGERLREKIARAALEPD